MVIRHRLIYPGETLLAPTGLGPTIGRQSGERQNVAPAFAGTRNKQNSENRFENIRVKFVWTLLYEVVKPCPLVVPRGKQEDSRQSTSEIRVLESHSIAALKWRILMGQDA
jgi:hypothetical protein